MTGRRNRTASALWRKSLDTETARKTPLGALVADVSSTAHYLAGFGLIVSVRELPAGALSADWLAHGEGPLLSPAGERTWNALLTLAQHLATSPQMFGASGDLAAVVLHPQAITHADAALQGEKREAA
ncbi:hypothetical protein [Caulobacter hibisci]|uniref:Uncharacterized protein n=1 Tax=Caulobacter hibisci TaxID=2035993 RepID=A0ABS0T0I8_9CAUL|nr:hypothetical protein [Caulobacter hibisci]MBI1684433.1 hypothetical protein [Caulobacter hibisci]